MKAFRIAALLLTTIVSLILAEAVVRVIDGYALFALSLRRTRVTSAASGTPDRQHLPASVSAGVKPEWYELSPPPVPKLPVPPEMAARNAKYPDDVYGAFYMWNEAYVRMSLCRGDRFGSLGTLDDFYTFEPVDGKPFPTYRHLPHANPDLKQWFTSNNFGYRGRDVTAARPRDTIRIVFVGSSATSDAYGAPFSHPELVGYWLNLWAAAVKLPDTIEVINAARTGVDSSSLAAIVRNEVRSLDPDLVVYYDAQNNFAAALDAPKTIPSRQEGVFRTRSWAEHYSAIVVRVLDAVLANAQDGSEPRKPGYHVVWPADVDEQRPDLARPVLPMRLDVMVGNLESVRESVASIGSELALTSFVWMAYPGMRLDMTRHLPLFRYLNDTFWPVTYEQMRRLMDFQNRVIRTFARQHGATYLPMDETYPRDPDLFDDAVHMNARGLRLRAWIYLQLLVPIIQARVASHAWPKAPSPNAPPADWAAKPPKLLSRQTILAACPS
jgi:hypothetical protein